MQNCDILVRNGYLVTMDEARSRYSDGAVAISEGRIEAIGASAEIESRFEASRVIDASGALVHPGFVECHLHVSLHVSRGAFPESTSWEDAVQFYVDFWNAVDDEDEHAASLLACLEMVRNGTTCFMEAGTVLEPACAAEASQAIGMRALLGDPILWDTGGFSSDAPVVHRAAADTDRALGLLGGQLSRNRDPDALVRGHVALVGMGSASDELTRAAKACADANRVVLNQHQSYASLDTRDDDRRHGRHPLVHYADIGALGSNCTFAHMNILRDDEMVPVIDSGMSIAWCPVASMLFGIGGTLHGRHLELHRAGVNLCLGSDSANWSGRFDLGTVAFVALLTQRERAGTRDALLAEDVLAMSTINGARATGLENRIGSLETGKRADLVIRSTDLPEAQPGLTPIQSTVYGARSKSVELVIVDGEVIVEGGHSVRVDESTVYARARESARRVLARMGRSAPAR